MSNTIRIKTTPNGGDNYIKVKLEQEFDFLEVLSLKISQEDTYRKFSSDYGVIVGRVVINGGFGVPNAKVSVFIPLDDIDKDNPLISGLYPYEVISDKDSDGIRYNLLTKESGSENECFTPIGTFPTKREVLDNEVVTQIYEKYYKFTSTTNFAGDFMFFGVPLGSHVVHVDADISDIGIASQRPYDLISQGAPVAKFDSSTKFLRGTNLDKLVQVKTLNAGVNVLPFWGDTEEYEIGVTRLDLDLNYDIIPAAIFMGSIYGDQDKHSVNKRCRPRKKLGELSEQVSGEGNIKMIRKTFNNQIEEFNVDGGELIDENGAWAYQVPMNLDYMVTAEDGSLILSEDPNRGIPTRARVRFDIGLSDTGGDGRLRTRARYLVPNNPYTKTQIDYEFGSKTKDTSFRDLYWNKIYTVSNFISRFQRNNSFTTALTRNATGIKNVDGGDGSKTPFPYNKVNTETNPLFFIICLIMKIIIFLMYIMNAIINPIINIVINIIKSIMDALCSVKILKKRLFGFACKDWSYVPCVSVKCPFDEEYTYAPGCKGGSRTYNATEPRPTYYAGDPFGHSGMNVGLDDCIAFEMAKTLNLFQFDFYNDWVNGSLFSYLLKYKKRKNGTEKFCEYNCDDIAGGGSDGNQNGSPDNNCLSSLILDSCFDGGKDCQKENRRVTLNEGLIKKYKNQFYYAATDKEARFKLYATDIVNMGSVFECDWLGIPKIQKSLIQTTYKMPPDTQELTDNSTQVETSGMVDIGGNTCGSFFSINCLGLHVDARQCLNIRHICEIGVDIDQATIDPVTNAITTQADCVIGVSDIDDASGKWFRDVFLGLNDTATPWNGDINLTLPYSSDFNLANAGNYNFAGTSNNGADYVKFRGYGLGNSTISDGNSFGQNKHSYYFYFGLIPGSTALDKMNKKFFTNCIVPLKANIVIESNSIPDTDETCQGSISFSFIGGIGPFSYVVTGLNTPNGNPLNITPISGSVNNTTIIINGLCAGTYSISGLDSVGTPVNDIITVNGPVPLYCFVNVTSNATSDVSSDGVITLSSVGGGIEPLYFEVRDKNGILAGTPSNGLATTNQQIIGLSTDTTIGYSVKVYDSDSPVNECITTGLTITGPSAINLTYSATNVHCFGESTGTITLNVTGGETPYDINVTGPYGFDSTGQLNIGTLPANPAGSPYIVTVVDALGSATTASIMLFHENPELLILEASDAEVKKQCDPNNYNIPFYIAGGVTAGLVNVEYSVDDDAAIWISNPMTFVNSSTPMVITIPKASVPESGVTIRFYVDSPACYSEEITYERSMMELPPNILTINDVDTPLIQYQNNKQCTPNVATYKFSISHLDVGYTLRTPYTIEYKIENSTTVNTFQHYGGMVSIVGNRNTSPAAGPVDNNVKFEVRVIDSKGCTTAWKTKNIVVPTAPLTGTITVSGGGAATTRTINATGGIGPYTESGIALPRTVSSSSVYVANIVDSVGCTVLKIG
jgi:hypothetical protein